MNRILKRRLRRLTAIVLTVCLSFLFPPLSRAEEEEPPPPENTEPVVAAPVMAPAVLDEYGDIPLTWEYPGDTSEIEGYELYRRVGKDGEYLLQYETYWEDETDYTDYSAEPGFTYYYRVRAYRYEYLPVYDDWGTEWSWVKVYGKYSNTVKVKVPLERTEVTLTSVDENTIKVQWIPISYADGYIIERRRKDDTKYKVILEVKKQTTKTYVDTGLKFGVKYYYRIRAYRDIGETRIFSKYSPVKSAYATMTAPKITKITVTGAATAELTWEPVNKAQGYRVYRVDENGKYVRVKTLTGKKTCTTGIKKLTNGVTYTYVVRAFTTLKGARLYGAVSKPKSRVMNYYGYEYEPWEKKVKRIFKQGNPVTYSSSAEASKNMKTIAIKAWGINSKGEKYSRTTYVTVHKKIAPTVQQIFKEIYEGKEKFPIKDIGGYSWRSNTYSEHCRGLAIDINYNENYMIRDGKIVAGSFWKPGKNVYSIPADGEVVTIMRKYGFVWGGTWNSSKDYMHFSYFGG